MRKTKQQRLKIQLARGLSTLEQIELKRKRYEKQQRYLQSINEPSRAFLNGMTRRGMGSQTKHGS